MATVAVGDIHGNSDALDDLSSACVGITMIGCYEAFTIIGSMPGFFRRMP
jgi:hypothetical protein